VVVLRFVGAGPPGEPLRCQLRLVGDGALGVNERVGAWAAATVDFHLDLDASTGVERCPVEAAELQRAYALVGEVDGRRQVVWAGAPGAEAPAAEASGGPPTWSFEEGASEEPFTGPDDSPWLRTDLRRTALTVIVDG
jgi:hypothetical protein